MPRTDEQIKKDVVDQLTWEPSLDASKVNVTVDRGVVTLSGEVPLFRDLATARSGAWHMQGVVDVIDHLTVRHEATPSIPDDAEIETRADTLLAWEPLVDEKLLNVSVIDGILKLEGTVDAHWKKGFIDNLLSGIRGLVRTENELAVVPSKRVTDEVVARDIVASLARDVRVDAEEVTVEVNDGVATLTGTVPNAASRWAAENDASFTSGVVGVRNELRLAAA